MAAGTRVSIDRAKKVQKMSFGSIPLRIRLPLAIVLSGLLMCGLVGSIGYFQLDTLARLDVDDSVTALLATRRAAVESFYADVERNVQDMSGRPQTLAGFRRLEMGWKSEGLDPQSALTADYITNNPHPQGKRMELDQVDPPNTYNTQHAQFQPSFRKWTQLHGYYDFFLIDLDGNVIFTVDKETDFASNLLTGPEAAGPLAAAFKAAKDDTSTTVHFSDFAKYGPSAGAPAAFAAKSILSEDGKVIGVFAIQISDAALDAAADSPTGLGETGEVTLVGPDGAARNASRFDGGYASLDPLPRLPQIVDNAKNDGVILRHTMLTSGQIGTAATTAIKIRGLSYNILVEIADSETYAHVISARNTLVLLTLLGAGALTLVGVLMAKTITGPIERVSGVIRTIAEGDLQVRIEDADRNDEIGDIAKSVDSLREKLILSSGMEAERQTRSDEQKRIVEELSVALRELSTGNLQRSIEVSFGEQEMLRQNFNLTIERLSETISMVVETSESIRSRAREISQSSEDLSGRTETQAATLQQTAAALDQLTASVRSAADGAKEVEGIVRSARNEAEESGKVVQGAVDAMTEIERSSDQISQIIGVIDDIAFQTNLLALNAGVEAARAGDAGKGFAVVASEVRALAQRSSAAAKEIKSLISASTQHVGRGVEQVGRAGDVLANIVNRVGHISNLVSNIASAATEQSTGLAEINVGVSQLDQVTQQNAAMVEESTAASQSMSEEAAGLSELVAQFQLRKTAAAPGAAARRHAAPPSAMRHATRADSPRSKLEPLPPAKAPLQRSTEAPSSQTAAAAKGKWQDF
ncbi:HAMP domain-containing protein [bacterium]|nr:HAMP domain-containing protein [bacterium]